MSCDHHGSRRNLLTHTAKASQEYFVAHNYENNKTVAILSTDLSAAFDTVDHLTLIKNSNIMVSRHPR